MPLRPLNREQTWLLPPNLNDLLPEDHPARFVAEFVDGLSREEWLALGIGPEGDPNGAPAYHPRALLCVWLYGFMTGMRSSRKLEGACRDQVPCLWLTGWQHPDHNTLWRFYQEHRKSLRCLLKKTVRTAVTVGLVDLAVQAVDGTKVHANAAKERTYDAQDMKSLLERTEQAINDLEAQNVSGQDPVPVHLPDELRDKQVLREKVKEALKKLEAQDGARSLNLTDADAALMKGRMGIIAGYNAQAMVSPLKGTPKGLFITAADVVTDPDDHKQLLPMLKQAEENTGEKARVTLADGGFHSGKNLETCAAEGHVVVMSEAQSKALEQPYHKDHFEYNKATDTYVCPHGHNLTFRGLKKRSRAEEPVRIYRWSSSLCQTCPAFGTCTRDARQGRALEIGPHEEALRNHREWMATKEAKAIYKKRKELPEPVFGILKEQRGARRFLLRGVQNVKSEWTLIVTAFNLRSLWAICRKRDRTLWIQGGYLTGPRTLKTLQPRA